MDLLGVLSLQYAVFFIGTQYAVPCIIVYCSSTAVSWALSLVQILKIKVKHNPAHPCSPLISAPPVGLVALAGPVLIAHQVNAARARSTQHHGAEGLKPALRPNPRGRSAVVCTAVVEHIAKS